ncbi:NUDIX domain-containing protein [Streptomyces sp. NPDC092046]|uniref:NUDIX domain-containing protein n=1 Tax=Streptomyces sp. NPDC092046 TaxID=3366009 RepID=UPI0038273F77
MTTEVLGAAALIVNDEGEYLLHLRDDLPGVVHPGTWSLLGGACDPDDSSLEETIARELEEEAGLVLAGLQPFTVVRHRWEGAVGRVQVFRARWSGDARALPLTEGVMLAWFPARMIARLRMCPWAEAVIRLHERGGDGHRRMLAGTSGG